ncbi:MAG: TIM barrel protein, partial [Leeuwenhoekiella sp.]
CKIGLEMAKASNSPFFAAHAGFCIDPDPKELGKAIPYDDSFDREQHKKVFLASVLNILEVADKLNINFLIENNVLAPFNYSGKNPLLCCDFEDIEWLFQQIEHKHLGLLLDTAHLKVSCVTLGKNLEAEFLKIVPYVQALHHSDNDGTHDSNESIDEQYWFLKFKEQFSETTQVLEVKNISEKQIESQLNLIQSSGN